MAGNRVRTGSLRRRAAGFMDAAAPGAPSRGVYKVPDGRAGWDSLDRHTAGLASWNGSRLVRYPELDGYIVV